MMSRRATHGDRMRRDGTLSIVRACSWYRKVCSSSQGVRERPAASLECERRHSPREARNECQTPDPYPRCGRRHRHAELYWKGMQR